MSCLLGTTQLLVYFFFLTGTTPGLLTSKSSKTFSKSYGRKNLRLTQSSFGHQPTITKACQETVATPTPHGVLQSLPGALAVTHNGDKCPDSDGSLEDGVSRQCSECIRRGGPAEERRESESTGRVSPCRFPCWRRSRAQVVRVSRLHCPCPAGEPLRLCCRRPSRPLASACGSRSG